MKQKDAILRVCASCEWVFKRTSKTDSEGCPKCGFGHYGARFVYGDKAYRYLKTQDPWLSKKMNNYLYELKLEIDRGMDDGHRSVRKPDGREGQRLIKISNTPDE
jgi:predicted  nucleic acid-binding Zn-ribbon protein